MFGQGRRLTSQGVSKTKTPKTRPKTHSKTNTLANEDPLAKCTVKNVLVRSWHEWEVSFKQRPPRPSNLKT